MNSIFFLDSDTAGENWLLSPGFVCLESCAVRRPLLCTSGIAAKTNITLLLLNQEPSSPQGPFVLLLRVAEGVEGLFVSAPRPLAPPTTPSGLLPFRTLQDKRQPLIPFHLLYMPMENTPLRPRPLTPLLPSFASSHLRNCFYLSLHFAPCSSTLSAP